MLNEMCIFIPGGEHPVVVVEVVVGYRKFCLR